MIDNELGDFHVHVSTGAFKNYYFSTQDDMNIESVDGLRKKVDNSERKLTERLCDICIKGDPEKYIIVKKGYEYSKKLNQPLKRSEPPQLSWDGKIKEESHFNANDSELQNIRDQLNEEFKIDIIPEWLIEEEIVINNKNRFFAKKEDLKVSITLLIIILAFLTNSLILKHIFSFIFGYLIADFIRNKIIKFIK